MCTIMVRKRRRRRLEVEKFNTDRGGEGIGGGKVRKPGASTEMRGRVGVGEKSSIQRGINSSSIKTGQGTTTKRKKEADLGRGKNKERIDLFVWSLNVLVSK